MSLFNMQKKTILFLLKSKTVFLAAFATGFLFSNANAFAAAAYGFAPRESDSSTLCKNGSEQGWPTAAINWKGEMDDHWSTASWDNFIQGVEFCEYNSARPSCHDHNDSNLDDGDAALFGTHGDWTGGDGRTAGTYHIKMSSEVANYPSSQCWASTEYWLLDDEAEFISSTSCSSSQYSDYMETYLKNKSKGLHQWHGYHGTTATGVGNLTDNFADDAFDGPISAAWLDNMTVFDYYPQGSDVCGMSFIFGENVDDCNDRRATEDYTWVDDDPPDDNEEGIKHYVCGCDPPGDATWTLPSC